MTKPMKRTRGKTPKPVKAWMCLSPWQSFVNTVAYTRRNAIETFSREVISDKPWEHLVRQGFRCVRVSISILPSKRAK